MKQIAGTLLILFALVVSASAKDAAPDRSGSADVKVNAPATEGARGKGDFAEPARGEGGSSLAEERRRARLDMMFERLAKASTKRRADRIARHIMRRLSRSGSPTVDVLMSRANNAMRRKRYGAALDMLDGVVRMRPDFAEGWNRRATVHFMRGDYGASLADIEQVLILEPRHWGALAGLSAILDAIERKKEALEVMDRALAVHPHLERVRERREKVAREVAGVEL